MSEVGMNTRSRRKRKYSPVKLTVKVKFNADVAITSKKIQVESKREESADDEKDSSDSEDDTDSEDQVQRCDMCDKTFNCRRKYIKHFHSAHRSQLLVCSCHGNHYKSQRYLISHEENVRNGTCVPRKNYRKYSQEMLLKAYDAVKTGKMSIRKASRLFHIPFTTLLDRVAGRISLDKTNSGPRPLLNMEDEEKLCAHVCFMSAIGYTYARHNVTKLASEFAIFKGILEEGKVLSDNWYRKFLRRWPDVAKKSRKKWMQYVASSEIVKVYFQEFVRLLESNSMLNIPMKILCISVYELELSQFSVKCEKMDFKARKTTESVSIILCCSASGIALDPFFVFNHSNDEHVERKNKKWKSHAYASPSFAKGITAVVLKDYLKHHLQKCLKAKEFGPVVIMYNGNEINFPADRIHWASKHGMMLFPLPPHTSKYQGSLSNDLKDMVKNAIPHEVKKYMKKNVFGSPVIKDNICFIITEMLPTVFISRPVAKLFKQNSVCPVLPNMIDPSIKFSDVASFDDSLYGDMDGVGSFFTAKLPIPNATSRGLTGEFKHRSVDSALTDILQKLPLAQQKTTTTSLNEQSFMNTSNLSAVEHSYYHDTSEVIVDNRVDYKDVIIKPEIQFEETICEEVIGNSGAMGLPTHNLISILPGSMTGVPFIETQVVSSVVEVGTTEVAYVQECTIEDVELEVKMHVVIDDEHEIKYVPV